MEDNRLPSKGLRSYRTELILLAVMAVLVAVDQLTKWLVTSNFSEVGQTFPLIDGVIHFTFVKNDGAVFGSLSGKPYIFNTVTVIVVIVMLFLLLSKRLEGNWIKWSITLIASGGIGNMIDRFRLKYVIDFIDVRCFGNLWVWVFNFADCCVVVGCMMMIVYFIADMIKDYKNKPKEETNDADN